MDEVTQKSDTRAQLVRGIGLFDATMIVMGGIIGSGIFMNPSVVARQVSSPYLILGVWALGGLIALAAAFIWAELAALRPEAGGQYVYLRDAFHPLVAFLYGWALLLVIQTGGMAAVAVTFAKYFSELTHVPLGDRWIAAIALLTLTLINCLGVKAGSTFQSLLMVLKIVAIVALIVCGLAFATPNETYVSTITSAPASFSFDLLTTIGAAMVPVLFAYGGWQTSTFVAGEIRNPRRSLPLALIIGVAGVVLLYLAVNFVCLYVLGPSGLAATSTPASDVMRQALGTAGARAIAAGIAISTFGFLSQSMLTAPRVYFAMAEDRLFFRGVAKLHPRTHVPVAAIAMQGLLAIALVFSKSYDQILSYVVSVDFIFFGATALCVFMFRRRRTDTELANRIATVPGHPVTTAVFVAICWLVVINTVYRYPHNTVIGLAILLAGIPVFFLWRSRR